MVVAPHCPLVPKVPLGTQVREGPLRTEETKRSFEEARSQGDLGNEGMRQRQQRTGPVQRRTAFTLVEMLVAMALTIFIMSIVTTAFVTSLETFRQLKGIGDMQEGLRTAGMRLRLDLVANHFDGRIRLSDANFKPREGFFRVFEANASTPEGDDQDTMPSSRDTDDVLHFSVKLLGDRAENFFSAQAPASSALFTVPTTYFNQPADTRHQTGAGIYNSQWAEVAYYLERIGSTDEPNNPASATGTPLWALYRIQRVVVPRNDNLTTVNVPATDETDLPNPPGHPVWNAYQEMSCLPPQGGGNLTFYTPENLGSGTGGRSFNPTNILYNAFNPAKPLKTVKGTSLLLDNVVSFQVELLRSNAMTGFDDVPDNGSGVRDFDSATTTNYQIRAIRVTLRVWDPNTRQTRQSSIIQDM